MDTRCQRINENKVRSMADTDGAQAPEHGHEGETRRDFLQLATGAFARSAVRRWRGPLFSK